MEISLENLYLDIGALRVIELAKTVASNNLQWLSINAIRRDLHKRRVFRIPKHFRNFFRIKRTRIRRR